MKRDTRALAAGLAAFVNFVNLYTPQAILPVLTADFAVAPARTGLTVTAPLIAVALVAPFAGGISDRVGRKRLIVGASLLLFLPTLVLAATTNFELFLLARFAQGLLLPFIFTVTVAYMGEELQGQQAVDAAGAYTIGSIIGGFGGRFLAGVIADIAGWRTAFVLVAIMTLLGAVLLGKLLPKEQRFRPITGGLGASLAAYARHLGNIRLLGTCAVGFGMLFSNVAVFTFVNFHLTAAPYNLSTSALGFVFAVYLVGIVTTTVATRLLVRIGRVATLVLALGLSAAGLCATLAPSLSLVILGLAGLSGGLFVTQTICINWIGANITRAKSSAVGLYVTIFYVGGSLGGIVPGLVFHAFGWQGVVMLVTATMMAMLAIANLSWARRGA